jgi:hypothetical protein
MNNWSMSVSILIRQQYFTGVPVSFLFEKNERFRNHRASIEECTGVHHWSTFFATVLCNRGSLVLPTFLINHWHSLLVSVLELGGRIFSISLFTCWARKDSALDKILPCYKIILTRCSLSRRRSGERGGDALRHSPFCAPVLTCCVVRRSRGT